MNASPNNTLKILDLPNEILLIIFNKLKTIDAVYSLVDINERFDQLVLGSLDIRNLDMTNMTMQSYYDRSFSIEDSIVDTICEKMLPRIYHRLNQLTIEQNAMERILLVDKYPRLYSLSLVNFNEEILYQYVTGILDLFS